MYHNHMKELEAVAYTMQDFFLGVKI